MVASTDENPSSPTRCGTGGGPGPAQDRAPRQPQRLVRSLIRPALAKQLIAARGSVGTLPPPAPKSPAPAPEPKTAPGWSPWKLEDGSWGSRFDGDTRALPDDPVGRVIGVTTKGGDSWTTTVVEVIHWDDKYILVRDSGKPK